MTLRIKSNMSIKDIFKEYISLVEKHKLTNKDKFIINIDNSDSKPLFIKHFNNFDDFEYFLKNKNKKKFKSETSTEMYKLRCDNSYEWRVKSKYYTFNSFVKMLNYMKKFTFSFDQVTAYCGDRKLNIKVKQTPVIYSF
jgi:hypothetical protein